VSYQYTTGIQGIPHGRCALLVNNASGFTVYQVTSGRRFRLTSFIATNKSGDAVVDLYDAASGAAQAFGESGRPMLSVIVPAAKTVALDERVLGTMELDFISAVVAFTTVSGVWVRVGGVEF